MATSSARAIGEGGATKISSAAGRNSRSVVVSCGDWRLRANAFVTLAGGCGGCGDCGAGMLRSFVWSRALIGASPLADALLRLHAPKPGVKAIAAGNQRVMRAVFDNRTIFERNNAIAMANGGEPMSDNDYSAPSYNLAHVGLNSALALVIQRACRLVQDQD